MSAAGVTWASRTLAAPWDARALHTSVIDAAGAIYVIGGIFGTGTYFQDVWVSTDGGADRTWSRGGRGVTRGRITGGTKGVQRGTKG